MDKKIQEDKFGSQLDLNARSQERAKFMDFGSVEKWMLPVDSVVSVAPDAPLLRAHEMMTKQQLSVLPVTVNGRFCLCRP